MGDVPAVGNPHAVRWWRAEQWQAGRQGQSVAAASMVAGPDFISVAACMRCHAPSTLWHPLPTSVRSAAALWLSSPCACPPACAPIHPALTRPHPHPPPQLDAFATIWRTEGVRGFYRGWAANSLKVIPQNAIRFVSYEALKSVMGIKKAKTDT